ncbi:MAG: glycosyltransferase [Lachnospiraceae bacterium]|nr:glycosyltransferase [Lachnospiraceae bacterium]
MGNTPEISVVLPIYNGERYLREALESIMNQTFINFELIIVDDASTDKTGKIIQEYLKKDERIKIIINKENQGLPGSLNIGFEKACGKYFTWTSDDNLYHNDALEKMYYCIKNNHHLGMVYAGMNLINEAGEKTGEKNKAGNCFVYNCIGACFLYKRECKELIGEYDTDRILVEDYDYWLRISSKFEIGYLNEILYDYRYHDKSLTFSKMKEAGYQLAKLKIDYIDDIIEHTKKEDLSAILFEIAVGTCDKDDTSIKKIEGILNEDFNWIFQRNKVLEGCEIWLFGAGAIGKMALNHIGADKVKGFIDNNPDKINTFIDKKIVISLDEYINNKFTEEIVIATDIRNAYFISKQLINKGISNFVVFYDLL